MKLKSPPSTSSLHHTINHLEHGKSTNDGNDTGRDNLGGTSSDDVSRGSSRRSTSGLGTGGRVVGGSGSRLGGNGSDRASSGGDERTLTVEGRVAKALSVGSSAVRHVGVSTGAALVVGVGALLSTALVLSGRRRLGGNVAGRDNGLGGGEVAVRDGDSAGSSDGDGLVAVGEGGGLRAVGGDSGDNLGGVDSSGLSTGVARGRLDELAALPGVVVQAGSVLSSAGSHVGVGGDTAVIVLVRAHLSAVLGVSGLGRSSIASAGSNGLGDGARAVLDGEGGGLSDGVGLLAVGESGGLRAVGGQVSDDLSGVLDGLVGGGSIVGGGGGSADEDAGDGGRLDETHFDGLVLE